MEAFVGGYAAQQNNKYFMHKVHEHVNATWPSADRDIWNKIMEAFAVGGQE